jgi:hypothetical protein
MHPAIRWSLDCMKPVGECIAFIMGIIPALIVLALQSKAKQPRK